MRNKVSSILAAAVMVAASIAPTMAFSQTRSQLDQEAKRRQQKKNEWRNITIGSGALAIIGLVSKNGTLALAGTAGALYSAYRYEQDRKSQSKTDRARAAYYGRSSIVANGVRYNRKTVWKNGKKYYTFVRSRNG